MRRLPWRSILPALLAIALFSGVVFLYLLPSLDRVVMDQKRLMIRELTESASNILARFEADEQAGRLSRSEAQAAAIAQVRNLHYGQQGKDYFWICDQQPRMVVHPYRPDLEGVDLSDFTDPDGRRPFVQMAAVVAAEGSGYVHYRWQWKDNPDRIVPKLSYVKGFAPWGWIIGTGVYTEDVDAEIAQMRGNLQTASLLILLAVSLLLFLLLRTGYRAETGRRRVAGALRDSEEKYRLLVESAGESIMMSIAGEGLYANASLLRLLGYPREEFARLEPGAVIQPTAAEIGSGHRHWQAVTDGVEVPSRYEAELACADGRNLRVMLTLSRIVVQGRAGFMAVASRLPRPRELDIGAALGPDDLEAANRRTSDLATLMMNHGADAVQVGRMLSAAADGIVRRAVELIVADLGPPPVAFDIMLMGSLGRAEVTLTADQDHALIHAAAPAGREADVQQYFLGLGGRLADLLATAGYPRCQGGVMASEPACCQSLADWRLTFDRWLDALEAEDLLHAKIFFDFRSALGGNTLVADLRSHLAGAIVSRPRFVPMLAHNILLFEPPLNSFGAFVLTDVGGARNGFDIKGVQAQVVDVARLRSLQHGLAEVGTLDRLAALAAGGHLNRTTATDTGNSYRVLQGVRLRQQAVRRAGRLPVDNMVVPDDLSVDERRELKQALIQLKALQENLRHEFGARQ